MISKKTFYIKKITLVLLLAILILGLGSEIAQTQDKVVTTKENLIEIRYGFDRPCITQVGNYHSVTIEGVPKIQKTGKPVLPVRGTEILIPFGHKLSRLEVIPSKKIELEGSYFVEPSQKPYPLSYFGPIEPTPPDPKVYNSFNPSPGMLNSEGVIQHKRDFNILTLNLYPVEYIPKERRLSYYENMVVKVYIEPVPSRRVLFTPSEKANIRKIVDNPETIDTYPTGSPQQTYQYVIITNNTLYNAPGPYNFQALVDNKVGRGITATIVTTEWIYANYDGTRPDGGTDQQTKIRNFIIDYRLNHGTEYVLLGGYIGIVPARIFWVQSWPGGYTANMPADMYYGCLDGTFDHDADGVYGEPNDGPGGADVDLLYDVYVGRAAVENQTELSNFIRKTLTYQNASDDYLRIASMVGEHLGFGGESEYAKPSMEEIRLGSDAHGYHTSGFEDSAYAECFITHYTEIPGCTAPPPLYDYDWSGHDWPKSVLIDFINSGNCGYPGVHILNHLGHANYTYCMKLYTSDLPSLNNDRYFFAYSQGCLPGGFDHTNCFAEEITSMEHGAFAVIMNARYGWGRGNSTDGPSQRYDRPFWDAVLDQDIFQLAKANAYSKEHFNASRINETCMRWCYYELNLFGDPELNIITGAGLLHDSHTIDDDNSGESSGNANGLVEPGETIEMPVTLRNYLGDGVTNVTAVLSTTDPYVTIISNTQSFGNIPAGGVATSAGNYVFSVDPSSDAHVINFHLDITANEGSWSTDFTEEVHKEPDITVSPERFEVTVPPGSTTTRTLTIGNVGLEELNWSIGSTPSLSQLMPTGSGGPDAYGYCWIDSDEAGGPTYNWVEISGIGTEIILSDDAYQEIDLPFTFSFYGVNKTSVKISSNGYLTFGTDGTDYSNDPIPNNTNPNDFIAPFWDDLNPRSGAQGHIYYYYDESNSRFIVEYKEIQHYVSGNPETFEVILYPNGSILYQYQALSYATSSTVGIENSDASTGLQVVYNSSYLRNELAVRISSGVDWLVGFQPESGTVAPGGSSDVTVTFDAAELTQGTYEANIFVNSNDPDESQVVIPATLHVGFTPKPKAMPMPWLFLLLD